MSIYRLAWPLLDQLDLERAHRLAVRALHSGAASLWPPSADSSVLKTTLLGLRFRNPVGLAAGFDKNGEVAGPLLRLGFGFVEVGTLTPQPQAGNPQPRLFRLNEDRAIINRMGFNNQGVDGFAARMGASRPQGIIGVNIGANRQSADFGADYVSALRAVAPFADYIAINVSSPNTAGLRRLQERRPLEDLVARLSEVREKLARSLPMLLKISPDIDALALEAIVETAIVSKLSGLIVSNTTTGERAGLKGASANEEGGLSGAPLFKRATHTLAEAHRLAAGQLVLIGVGGIFSARDAYEKVLSGASLVQVYTGLIYEGPGLVGNIKRGLAKLLARDGFRNISEAVGAHNTSPRSEPKGERDPAGAVTARA